MRVKIISEIGINHNGCIDNAKRLIDLSVASNCNYVKIQKRNPDDCVPDMQKNKTKSTPWGEMKYLDYRKRIEFDFDQINLLFNYSNEKGIVFFASVWDLHSAKLMKKIGSKIVKIPSAFIVNLDLCKFARDNFEKLIISTGMSTEEEIEKCIEASNPDVILHCNSTYPCPFEDINLNYIKWLMKKWPSKEIGYSGHEEGFSITHAAVAIGAKWIERHVTLDKKSWGSDQSFSLNYQELKNMNSEIRNIEKSFFIEEGPRILFEKEIFKKESLRN